MSLPETRYVEGEMCFPYTIRDRAGPWLGRGSKPSPPPDETGPAVALGACDIGEPLRVRFADARSLVGEYSRQHDDAVRSRERGDARCERYEGFGEYVGEHDIDGLCR